MSDKFLSWYAKFANKYGLDDNPDNPLHFYDYRAAYKAGVSPDKTGHWPSEFKKLGHPNLIIDGIDTRTGKQADPKLELLNQVINSLVNQKYNAKLKALRR